MTRSPLNYRRLESPPPAAASYGFVALTFSFTGIGLGVIGLMCLLCRMRLSDALGDLGRHILLVSLGIASAGAMFLSFGLGVIACFRRGNSRESGLSAIALSTIWLIIALLLACAQP
jgi:hypothetical protein